jgi:hypothetical protein
MTDELPPWLPEWNGASEVAARIDVARLRADIHDLVDYVLAEESVVLDSLPADLESSLVPPLALLAHLIERDSSVVELVVAARLVRRAAKNHLDDCPPEVARRLAKLPP